MEDFFASFSSGTSGILSGFGGASFRDVSSLPSDETRKISFVTSSGIFLLGGFGGLVEGDAFDGDGGDVGKGGETESILDKGDMG